MGWRATAVVAPIVFLILRLSCPRSRHWSAIRAACVGSTGRDGGAGSCFDCAWDCMTHVSLYTRFNDWDANLTFHSKQPGYFIHNLEFTRFCIVSLSLLPKASVGVTSSFWFVSSGAFSHKMSSWRPSLTCLNLPVSGLWINREKSASKTILCYILSLKIDLYINSVHLCSVVLFWWEIRCKQLCLYQYQSYYQHPIYICSQHRDIHSVFFLCLRDARAAEGTVTLCTLAAFLSQEHREGVDLASFDMPLISTYF